MSQSPIEYPNNLTAAEYHELTVGSAIHPALIERNFFHIEGETVYDYLFISPTLPRKNAGRVTDGLLKLYLHLMAGGMWIASLDPYNDWKPMEWGRIKPTNPRIDWLKGKSVKYESPPKVPNRVTYFDIADCIWKRVARRYNIKRYDSPLARRLQDRYNLLRFWEWVISHPEIPIILCEGEKKAACLLSLGFVAIALPGIWNGRVGKKDFDERLHPDLLPLAQPGRKFQILFDYETKLKTRWSVYQATVRTGKAIEAVGCVCEVALLSGPEKGVDDFVVARGEDANALLTAIIDDAHSLKDYQQSFLIKHRGLRKYRPDALINTKYLTQAVAVQDKAATNPPAHTVCVSRTEQQPEAMDFPKPSPPEEIPPGHRGKIRYKLKKLRQNKQPKSIVFPLTGLVVLISDMGTGKTELMRWWRDAHPDQRFLNNGHRVNLLKNLAERLKTLMYSDLGYAGMATAQALSITIDSLYKLNTQALAYGCIFIDETCQYLTHLLHSNTCKEHRALILSVLEHIVYNAPLVVIADAHMDDITIDFFLSMRPVGEQPYIIKNEWKNGERTIYWYEGMDSSALVAQISAAIMMSQKLMVVSDSKRFIKKLERMFTVRIEPSSAPSHPHTNQTTPLRIWSIHSDNSGSEENVAFIKDITNAVKNIDVLLTSPSLGTGVDISQYHFDLVFGVFHAVSQTATECAQQLWRYRPKVPIHVWVAPTPPFGYKETNPTKIKERLLQTNEITAFLIKIDRETGKRGVEKDWALDAYCQIQASRHQSINNLRADLRSLLSDMGNTIVPTGDHLDVEAWESLKYAADALDAAHHQSVAKANTISRSEYRARQSKDYLSPDEAYECEKFRIWDSYGMEVTESLVEKDNGGKLISAIASLEAILASSQETILDSRTNQQYPAPPEFVSAKDLAERNKLPFCMDWSNYSAKWLARFNLGLHDILKRLVTGEEITSADEQLLLMTRRAKECAAHIKAILGFTIPSDCQPIWLLATLVAQLGLSLDFRKQGKRGQQVKLFFLSKSELNFALQVIAHRQKQRADYIQTQPLQGLDLSSPSVSTPLTNGIGNSLVEGVDTTASKEVGGLRCRGAEGQESFTPAPHHPCAPASECDRTALLHCVEMLRSGIALGFDAIKGILKRWTTDWRWEVVLELDEIAPDELQALALAFPQFYDWLSEAVLPVEGG
ncbi:DUF3854 domain-containing protein [Nostoc sp. FACHB-87]|uniref:plasmid replication protein, CyRepA1 family n=1 Tax=Nostocaceae TaxID=1162 RepID=UPI0016834218|nr:MULTISPECIES: plasmid replication protein, CyRepA1 family [Nostocaceae]MBD2303491.1 DUF3854 domain-containing protein [Nostoc sp. FACHB-190]MBD2458744.1 DUF3854 domain-containing protein [Nostoc sp. FACHB-87]MBD2479783.1 DUF3854 domain-containing protein [Anabaena sp. FACHB-83]